MTNAKEFSKINSIKCGIQYVTFHLQLTNYKQTNKRTNNACIPLFPLSTKLTIPTKHMCLVRVFNTISQHSVSPSYLADFQAVWYGLRRRAFFRWHLFHLLGIRKKDVLSMVAYNFRLQCLVNNRLVPRTDACSGALFNSIFEKLLLSFRNRVR